MYAELDRIELTLVWQREDGEWTLLHMHQSQPLPENAG